MMTADEYEVTAPRARALLNAMQKTGKLMTRQQLADATGKYRLSPNDIRHLNDMVRAGIIEEGKLEDRQAVGGFVLAYRAVTDNS